MKYKRQRYENADWKKSGIWMEMECRFAKKQQNRIQSGSGRGSIG